MAASMSLIRTACGPSAALATSSSVKNTACPSVKLSLPLATSFTAPLRPSVSTSHAFLSGEADLASFAVASSLRRKCRQAGKGGALQAQAVAEFVETREPTNGALPRVTLPYEDSDSELETAMGMNFEDEATETEAESEPEMDPNDIRNFGLSRETVRALQSRGIDHLFAIQVSFYNVLLC